MRHQQVRLWFGLLVMWYLAFIPVAPPRDGEPMVDGYLLLVFAIIMAVVVWWFWRRQVARGEIFRQFAVDRGWEFRPAGDDVTSEPFARLPLFYKASQNKLTPLIMKQDGSRLQVGDFAFVSGATMLTYLPVMVTGGRWHQTVALAQSRHRRLPLFVVAPRQRSVLAPYTGQNLQRMTFPEQPGGEIFEKTAVLLTRKPELMRELLAGEKLADFVETIVQPLLASRLALEAGGSWVAVYESNGLARADELPWLVEFAEKTAAYFLPEP